LRVYEGGAASSTTINGGTQDLWSGSAISTTINGGLQKVRSGGTTTGTTINGGQSWLMTGAVANGETSVSAGGELLMDAGSLATDVNIPGAPSLSMTFPMPHPARTQFRSGCSPWTAEMSTSCATATVSSRN
jgi:autotransporter passenger strand-loop-strand repeat protein